MRCGLGVVGVDLVSMMRCRMSTETRGSRLECRTVEGESPVPVRFRERLVGHPSIAGHEKPCENPGGPPPKANYADSPIVHEYREGTVKSTPEGE